MMAGVDLKIRGFEPGDETRAYEVCRRTGNLGGDATDLFDDPELLGHIWLGPYLALAPRFAFMLVDLSNQVVGYAVGVPDTAEFARECERSWWPALRAHYPEDVARRASDAELVSLIHHPPSAPADLLVRFPAHLHIDLLPEAQGRGHGQALMAALLAELASAGAPGVHLYVGEANTRAVGFYQRLGFDTLEVRDGSRLMVHTLAGSTDM
jgi:ribosomal protein S18 acetylase RimI-like enzyme